MQRKRSTVPPTTTPIKIWHISFQFFNMHSLSIYIQPSYHLYNLYKGKHIVKTSRSLLNGNSVFVPNYILHLQNLNQNYYTHHSCSNKNIKSLFISIENYINNTFLFIHLHTYVSYNIKKCIWALQLDASLIN